MDIDWGVKWIFTSSRDGDALDWLAAGGCEIRCSWSAANCAGAVGCKDCIGHSGRLSNWTLLNLIPGCSTR